MKTRKAAKQSEMYLTQVACLSYPEFTNQALMQIGPFRKGRSGEEIPHYIINSYTMALLVVTGNLRRKEGFNEDLKLDHALSVMQHLHHQEQERSQEIDRRFEEIFSQF